MRNVSRTPESSCENWPWESPELILSEAENALILFEHADHFVEPAVESHLLPIGSLCGKSEPAMAAPITATLRECSSSKGEMNRLVAT